MNKDLALKVFHAIIDLLGGGAGHLHNDLDAAFGVVADPAAPPELSQAEKDTLAALQARQAAIDAASAPAPAADAEPAV